jgi:transposase
MLQRLADAGLVKAKTVGIDATTLEANAALRSIVRRDTGESYQNFLTKLAQASGIETPTRADLARIDRKRKKKGSNDDWTHPHDPDAKITKMKDGRTHLAHKAEHVVDLDTGAIVGVTVQDADDGDTTTSIESLIEAAEQVEAVCPDGDDIEEVVGDKGYHSNQSLLDLEAVGVRSYISEPDRGRRNWTKNPAARDAVYRNRRRIRGPRGLRLLRRRGERLERPFAHLYETGGMRRVHLRGHTNIRKRVLIHAGGFNLGLLMRTLIGAARAAHRQRSRVLRAHHAHVGARARSHPPADRAGQADAERVRRILQRPLPRRMPQRALVHQPAARPAVIETWRREYNEERPKKGLGGLTPAAYARRLMNKTGTVTAGL